MRITDTHIYFWGSIYSNWYICNFKSTEHEFNCSEQYFMYHKAFHFDDNEIAQQILLEKNPRKQKEFGKKVKNYSDEEWSKHRYTVMCCALILKFKQNPDLMEQLLNTGNKIFVEASPYDCVWGVGLAEDNDLILDEKNWRGQNLLGKALCETREYFRKQNGEVTQ
jgi:ribA/ribD-fused uncharacterized protein